MSIFGNYDIPASDIELEQKMKQFLDEALVAERFCNLDHVKTVALWFKESKESKKEVTDKHYILSSLVNKLSEKLLEYAQPYYKNTIVKKIGTETELKEGIVIMNFNIGFIPIEPYVEFDKIINGKEFTQSNFNLF